MVRVRGPWQTPWLLLMIGHPLPGGEYSMVLVELRCFRGCPDITQRRETPLIDYACFA